MKTKANPRQALRLGSRAKIEICILAGGLSSRMGQDKSKLRMGRTTLLTQIRRNAKILGFPVRVIRRDLVPRCGPLGGIYTALKTSSAESVLFLACDMPQISELLLRKILKQFGSRTTAVFTESDAGVGFPFLLRCDALAVIERLLRDKRYSLQLLSKETGAKQFRVSKSFQANLINVNTPGDLEKLTLMQRCGTEPSPVA